MKSYSPGFSSKAWGFILLFISFLVFLVLAYGYTKNGLQIQSIFVLIINIFLIFFALDHLINEIILEKDRMVFKRSFRRYSIAYKDIVSAREISHSISHARGLSNKIFGQIDEEIELRLTKGKGKLTGMAFSFDVASTSKHITIENIRTYKNYETLFNEFEVLSGKKIEKGLRQRGIKQKIYFEEKEKL